MTMEGWRGTARVRNRRALVLRPFVLSGSGLRAQLARVLDAAQPELARAGAAHIS